MGTTTKIVRDLATTTNQIGIVMLFALPYEYDYQYSNKSGEVCASPYEPSPYSINELIVNKNLDIPSDEDVILTFAEKLFSSSRDIEPEIGQAISKRLWDYI